MRNGLVLLLVMVLAVPAFAAGIDGKWNFVFNTEGGVREATMTLAAKGGEVSGKVGEIGSQEAGADVKGTIAGDAVSLSFPYYSEDTGYKADVKMKGKFDGDKIAGDWEFSEHSGTFSATRAQ